VSTLRVLTFLAALTFAGFAAAMEIHVDVSPRVVFDDGALEVEVKLVDPDRRLTSLRLEVPEALTSQGPFGPRRMTTITNGRRSESVSYSFRVRPRPGTEGEVVLGPVVLEFADGGRVESPLRPVQVRQRAPRGVQMRVSAEPAGGPVGMPFRVTYEVLYSGEPFLDEDTFGRSRNPFGLQSLSLPLLSRDDVRTEPIRADRDGEASQLRLGEGRSAIIQRGWATLPDGTYEPLRMAFQVTPMSSGAIELGGAAGLSLRDGTRRARDVFGRTVEVPKGRAYSATADPLVYRVEELPAAGRPAGFTGAVGRFTITCRTEAREVAAYDPIPLEVEIRGAGLLERVVLPPWHELPEVADAIDVATDTDAGEVVDGAKRFRVVVRARSSAVTAIPPLPFPYYDPASRRYEVARSEPIPITVRDVRTVGAGDAIAPAGAGAPATPAAGTAAPRARALDGIPANFEEPGVALPMRPSATLDLWVWLALLAPPGILLLITAGRALRGDDHAALRRRELARARGQLAGAATSEATYLAYGAWLRARLALPAGELTPAELRAELTGRGVDPALVGEAVGLLERLVAVRYAPGAGLAPDLSTTVDRLDGAL
jgi:hypothetical protein